MKIKQLLISVVLIPFIAILCTGCGKKERPEKMMLGNFDKATQQAEDAKKEEDKKPEWNAWHKDINDETQGCEISYTTDETIKEGGQSLKVTYDVDSTNPAYDGMWLNLNRMDISPYTNLVFQVKGDLDAGFTEKFKVELKNEQKEVGSHIVMGVTENWQKITIPLKKFGLTDFSSMTEFVVVFVDNEVTEKTGTLYLTDVHFE